MSKSSPAPSNNNKAKLPPSLEGTFEEFERSLQSLQTALVQELEKPVDESDKKKMAERQLFIAYLLNVLFVSLKMVQGSGVIIMNTF